MIPVVMKERFHYSSVVDGISYSEWDCSNCREAFLFGPGIPRYCPRCGERIDRLERVLKAEVRQ